MNESNIFVTLIPHRVAGNLEFIPGEQGGGQPEQGAITLQGIIANTIKQSSNHPQWTSQMF